MRYLSVCSGIEAATQAWHPLGWTPVGFSEIEAFPSVVLSHHYPGVPNFGDMTKFKDWPDDPIDLLVGGTPCQSFSVAGLRKGLDDPRGNLMLTYGAIARHRRPKWLVWENVPGVLSRNGGRDFGTFLGSLGQLGYGFAYRVLDAQYVRVDGLERAVPQRRRRVFVVGHLGDWRRAAAVLFDGQSLRWDHPPRREAGQGAAASLTASSGGCSGKDGIEGRVVTNSGPVGYCLTASAQQSLDAETETLIAVAHALRGEGFDASEDGTGRGTPLVPVAYRTTGNDGAYETGDVVGALTTTTDPNAHVVAFSAKDHGGDASEGVSPTLRAGAHSGSHQNGGVMPAVACDLRGREGGAMPEGPHDTANIRAASGGSSRSYIAQPWAVRRLMPVECERLQGFPDGWTDVSHRGKPAADGPRYKALGNSMAVNVMRWIGERIAMVEGWQ